MITPSEVRQRLEELSAPQIGKVARYYDDHREELAPWNDLVMEAIINRADKSSVIAGDLPPSIVTEILLTRSELVDFETIGL